MSRSRLRMLPLLVALALACGACALLPPLPWRDTPPPEPPLLSQPPSQLRAPEGLRATSGEYREIPLQWDPLLDNDVGGYRIERSDEREGPFLPLVAIWGRGVTARSDATLGDGVTRYYRIRAFTRDGRISENASEVVVGTTAPLPDPPEGLRAYSRQPREVPLSWRAAEDPRVAGYVLERSPSPDGPFERIVELSGRHATAYVDQGLGDLRVFYYRVSSTNAGGASGKPCDPVRAVTKPVPLPPMGLRLDSQRLGVNQLAWEPNVEEDIAEYRLYRVAPGAPRTLVVSVPGNQTQALDRGVAAGELVTYVLVAVDRDGLESRPSEPVATSGVRYGLAAEVEGDGIHLSWDPRRDEGFASARVERESWFGRRSLGTSETGHFVDHSVEPGGTYRYVAVLLRPDTSEAPASRPLAVHVPADAEFR